MRVNKKTAAALFCAYTAVIAILFLFWVRTDNNAFFIVFQLLLIALSVWIFLKARYFMSLSKGDGKPKDIEILIARIFSIVMFGSSCYVIYVNTKYL